MSDAPAGFVKVHNPKVAGDYLLIGDKDPMLSNYTRFDQPAPKAGKDPKPSKDSHGGKAALGTAAAPVAERSGPSESPADVGGTVSTEAAFVEEAAPKARKPRAEAKPRAARDTGARKK